MKNLGLGMCRGSMELGRPRQGHYIPPDRVDYTIEEEKQVEVEETGVDVPEV